MESKVKKWLKKIIIGCVLGFVLVCAAFLLWIFWDGFLVDYIPYTKTNFRSYEEFRERTHNYFPDALPSSARDIKYYFYEGKLDEFYAVGFTADMQDYEEIKNHYAEYFEEFRKKRPHVSFLNGESFESYIQKYEPSDRYKNLEVSPNFIQEENLDFLNDMMNDNISNYIIIDYIGGENTERKTISGVIVNEGAGEIIIFEGQDVFPK